MKSLDELTGYSDVVKDKAKKAIKAPKVPAAEPLIKLTGPQPMPEAPAPKGHFTMKPKPSALSRLASHSDARRGGPISRGTRIARDLRARRQAGLETAKAIGKTTKQVLKRPDKVVMRAKRWVSGTKIRQGAKSLSAFKGSMKGFKAAGLFGKAVKLGAGILRTGGAGYLVQHNITYSAPKIAGAAYHGAKAISAEAERRSLKKKSEEKYGSLEAAARTRRRLTGGR
jgi:hypothetical protein